VSGVEVKARNEVQGDSREPFIGARKASGVWTQFDVPFERFEEVRDELPRCTYIGRSDDPDYANVGVRIIFSFDTGAVELF